MTETREKSKERIGVRGVVQIGMLSAIAIILMQFEVPLPFAPPFYKIDFSEIPVLIGCFVMGPLAGAIVELIKVILNVVISGTTTGGVGDIANFLIGCAMCVPAGMIYKKYHTRKSALVGMAVGTVFMTVIGCILNAYVLLPVYAKAFEMPIDALVAMGTAVNHSITSLSTFVIFAVAPFNLLKGGLVSFIVFLIYKKISPILKMNK
ncbi:MAG: ECF transporter S component [Clostridiales bacterium]|nr:ECF transporter S component [Clostridiales bacterium]